MSAAAPKIIRVTRTGFASVNTWVIEGKKGVVVIDAQRGLAMGREIVAAVQATEKPLLAVIITHPHPDHFGGLAAILGAYPEVPVYASQTTTEVIRTDSNGYQAATLAAIPDDSPDAYPVPTVLFEDGEQLDFGSLKFVVDEIGSGEAESMTMLDMPQHNILFVGDLVANGMTGFLLEQRSNNWIAQIDSVLASYGARNPHIYPGHGPDGELTRLLAEQKHWLVSLQRLVMEKLGPAGISDDDVAAVSSAFSNLYPNFPEVAEIPNLLDLNIRSVAHELSMRS